MKVIDVLRHDDQVIADRPLEPGEGAMGRIGLHACQSPAPSVVEGQHGVGVDLERLRRGDVFDAVPLPQPIGTAEGGHAALGRDAGAGEHADDLHERAGSERVVHMHGDLFTALCEACGNRSPHAADLIERPPCPNCGERMLRPDVVWFGEMPYELDRIDEALLRCDLFAAIGTSGGVYPAAGFVMIATEFGARTIELNLAASEVTPLFDEVRHGPASIVVPEWVEEQLAAIR